MPRLSILPGDRYGKLVVVREIEPYVAPCGKFYRNFLCSCDCGSKVVVRLGSLRSGHTTSCGCWQRQRTSEASMIHGMHGISEYAVWCTMIQRCTNPNDSGWHRYGGRGITVCNRWIKFENFLADMGRRPFPKAQIDRVNNSLGYGPDNCQWTTRRENMNNKRNNRCIEWRGDTRTLAEWGRHLGIRASTLLYRLDKLGWSVERSFTEPVRVRKHSTPVV
jgi:hypothetical protein